MARGGGSLLSQLRRSLSIRTVPSRVSPSLVQLSAMRNEYTKAHGRSVLASRQRPRATGMK